MAEYETNTGQKIVNQLQRSGVHLEISSTDPNEVVVSTDSVRTDLTAEEDLAISNNKTEVVKDLINILKLNETISSDILTYINTGMINDYNFNQVGKITKDGGVGKYSKYLSEEEMQYINKYYAQWIK